MTRTHFIALTTGIAVALTAVTAMADNRREPVQFETLDTDGNGALTQEELQARGDARFNEIDADADGFLSEAELANAGRENANQRAARILSRLDANNDGKLGRDEMRPRNDGRMFERADADGNGSISEEEFAELQSQMRKRRGGRW